MQNLEVAAPAILQLRIEKVLVQELATVQWKSATCIDLLFVC
jgi:hypothetical protein